MAPCLITANHRVLTTYDFSLVTQAYNSQKIQCAIRAKSTGLQKYRSNLTRELKVSEPAKVEVRLLLFANHLWEYGMLRIETDSTFDLCGFDFVYFFPVPGNPVELKKVMASPLRVGVL